MNELIEMLEGFADGQKVLVRLKGNEEFILYDFELVDESIYERSDLVMASISDVLNSQFKYKVGTKIEISVLDVISLNDPVTEDCFFTA
jgi:hypothetical protein